LGEELDHQLAKAEAKAKDEARQEAQRQMDSERKKITQEMEVKLNELTSQIKTFEKVISVFSKILFFKFDITTRTLD